MKCFFTSAFETSTCNDLQTLTQLLDLIPLQPLATADKTAHNRAGARPFSKFQPTDIILLPDKCYSQQLNLAVCFN